jgi:hypothetical protein
LKRNSPAFGFAFSDELTDRQTDIAIAVLARAPRGDKRNNRHLAKINSSIATNEPFIAADC